MLARQSKNLTLRMKFQFVIIDGYEINTMTKTCGKDIVLHDYIFLRKYNLQTLWAGVILLAIIVVYSLP